MRDTNSRTIKQTQPPKIVKPIRLEGFDKVFKGMF